MLPPFLCVSGEKDRLFSRKILVINQKLKKWQKMGT